MHTLQIRAVGAACLALLVAGCTPRPPPAATHRDQYRQRDHRAAPHAFFQRYTAPDRAQLAADIRELRAELQAARAAGDRDAALRATADLGERLTTARDEPAAIALLTAALAEAAPLGASETLGWLWLNLATANQYAGHTAEAAAQFPRALALARSLRAEELEHYALHHAGRFLVEQGELARARASFEQALAIRVRLGAPLQASTRRALEALARLER